MISVSQKETFQLGPKALFSSKVAVSLKTVTVVGSLKVFIDGGRHLNFNFFVDFVLIQPLTLDLDEFLLLDTAGFGSEAHGITA